MTYFFSKKGLPNYIVWIVALVPSYIIKYGAYVKKEGDSIYVVLEGLSWLVLVVLLTGCMHFVLDKISKNNDKLIFRVLKFFGLVIISTLLFNLILWPLLDYIYDAIHQSKEQPSYGKTATNIFNIFIWIIWFITIRLVDLLKEIRETRLKNIQLKANLKESQLNTLKGQINPHFMFNSLNNIRGLMLEDVDKARHMLTNLSETLRYTLTKSNTDSIALEDELEMVENYVEISKIQFEDRLKFETKIDENSLNTQIPPMIIQMLVENALKHGISNLKLGGKVSLETELKNNHLYIEVANSGKLQQNNNSTQVGVENIKKRLELLYGDATTFSLKEIENRVVATIKIPLS